MSRPRLKTMPALDAPSILEAAAAHQQGRLADAERIYRAILAQRPDDFDASHLLGVLVHQQGQSSEGLRLVSAALRINPRAVDALANHGVILNALGRHKEAVANFDRALKIDPNHLAALYNRGNALLKLEQPADAIAAYDKALAVNPAQAPTLNNRGIALAALARWDEAIVAYGRSLQVDPKFGEAYLNRGTAFTALVRCEEALADFARALKVQPNFPEAMWNASLVHLLQGNFHDGWRDYEARWEREAASQRRTFAQPLWLGDAPIEGRRVLLHAEQGLGDTLQFVRYARLVQERGATVILEVQPPLQPLLASMAGIETVVGRREPLPPPDLHCPLMSLPLAFGTALDTIPADIPYLWAPAERLTKWQARLGALPSPRVGIVWAGSATHKNDKARSIPPHAFAPLLRTPGVTFVSLQKDAGVGDLAALGRHGSVVAIGDELADFADTAAAVAHLDLVVTVDTSVVHLAGAMGKPVWLLLPFSPDFRWLLEREDSPWYPTARLFRQERIGDWDGVLDRVRGALERMRDTRG